MNNQFITTTELREQSSKLVQVLLAGGNVSLIHRSKVIGTISPANTAEKTITNIQDFQKSLQTLKPKQIIPVSKRDEIYRAYLKKRHG